MGPLGPTNEKGPEFVPATPGNVPKMGIAISGRVDFAASTPAEVAVLRHRGPGKAPKMGIEFGPDGRNAHYRRPPTNAVTRLYARSKA